MHYVCPLHDTLHCDQCTKTGYCFVASVNALPKCYLPPFVSFFDQVLVENISGHDKIHDQLPESSEVLLGVENCLLELRKIRVLSAARNVLLECDHVLLKDIDKGDAYH